MLCAGMERLFGVGARPGLAGGAAVSACGVAAGAGGPPALAAGGPGALRGWRPAAAGESWEPAPEVAGAVPSGAAMRHLEAVGDTLCAADAAPEGRVWVFDMRSWAVRQVLDVGGRITCLAASERFLAVGTTTGRVRVWARMESKGGELVQLFNPDLRVDAEGVRCIRLVELPSHGPCLIAHKAARLEVGLWRLGDGKIVHAWGDTKSGACRPMVASASAGSVLATVLWEAGKGDANVHLIDVLTGEGGRVPPNENAAGAGKPMSCAFNGRTVCLGFSSGRVVAVGYRQWMGHHGGEVGHVAVCPKDGRFISAGADGVVKLWTEEGLLVCECRLEFQITGMHVRDAFVLLGGDSGELEVLSTTNVGGTSGDAVDEGKSSSATIEEVEGDVVPYLYSFDARAVGGPSGKATDHLDFFEEFYPSWPAITASDKDSRPDVEAPAGATTLADSSSGSGSSEERDEGSSFNAAKALEGASQSAEPVGKSDAEALDERAKQAGDAPGVARKGEVRLDSSLKGRKCDNRTCLQHEAGNTKFKRCGGCKHTLYCSTHCQRTHWRDGHSKECKKS